jgi:hypothetical protein
MGWEERMREIRQNQRNPRISPFMPFIPPSTPAFYVNVARRSPAAAYKLGKIFDFRRRIDHL